MQQVSSPGGVWGSGLLLAAALAGAPAGAAPVASAEAGVMLSMGTQAPLSTFFENLPGSRPSAALPAPPPLPVPVATLHDFLAAEESPALAPERAGALAPAPRQLMIHGLLADLALALHALQEGGDEAHLMASRETGPGAYLRVAQQSRSRSSLY
ncbi:MAG TPA: hypothetical protein PLA97_09190 [Rubrivivax sp.]|nr:hypothetical protein [Rubrivivax sp.]